MERRSTQTVSKIGTFSEENAASKFCFDPCLEVRLPSLVAHTSINRISHILDSSRIRFFCAVAELSRLTNVLRGVTRALKSSVRYSRGSLLGFTESLQQRYTSSGVVRRSLRSASSEGPLHLRSRLGLVLVLVWSWSGLGRSASSWSGLGRSASSWSGLGRSASSWSGLVACCVAHARSHDWPPPGGKWGDGDVSNDGAKR